MIVLEKLRASNFKEKIANLPVSAEVYQFYRSVLNDFYVALDKYIKDKGIDGLDYEENSRARNIDKTICKGVNWVVRLNQSVGNDYSIFDIYEKLNYEKYQYSSGYKNSIETENNTMYRSVSDCDVCYIYKKDNEIVGLVAFSSEFKPTFGARISVCYKVENNGALWQSAYLTYDENNDMYSLKNDKCFVSYKRSVPDISSNGTYEIYIKGKPNRKKLDIAFGEIVNSFNDNFTEFSCSSILNKNGIKTGSYYIEY